MSEVTKNTDCNCVIGCLEFMGEDRDFHPSDFRKSNAEAVDVAAVLVPVAGLEIIKEAL